MNKIYRFVILVLAVYRISRMIALEDGPADIFANLREFLGQGDWIGRGFHCVLCVSVWVSLAAALLAFRKPRCILAHWFAIAGGVALIREYAR